MSVHKFFKKSGLKALSLEQLNEIEYAICIYLLNCAYSGFEQIIITNQELASILKRDIKPLSLALIELTNRNIVKIKQCDSGNSNPNVQHSIALSFEFDINCWKKEKFSEVHAPDAIIYPFVKNHFANLSIIDGQGEDKKNLNKKHQDDTWRRVLNAFLSYCETSEEANKDARLEKYAKELVKNHPVDQILLLIRHFGQRIPSLSLLGSSWHHYHNLYETETAKVDFLDARKKHNELDREVKETSRKWLKEAKDRNLTQEEMDILKLLIDHRHPRRQLFWAYQLRSRYQNLVGFFHDNAGKMLPVTSSGKFVKIHLPKDSES